MLLMPASRATPKNLGSASGRLDAAGGDGGGGDGDERAALPSSVLDN